MHAHAPLHEDRLDQVVDQAHREEPPEREEQGGPGVAESQQEDRREQADAPGAHRRHEGDEEGHRREEERVRHPRDEVADEGGERLTPEVSTDETSTELETFRNSMRSSRACPSSKGEFCSTQSTRRGPSTKKK